MANTQEEILLVYAFLKEKLQSYDIHPMDRLCIDTHLQNLESKVEGHPFYKNILSYSFDGDYLNQKTIANLRKKIFDQLKTATVEFELEHQRPESGLLELFENWLFDAPTGEKISAKDLYILVTLKSFTKDFFNKVDEIIERYLEFKRSSEKETRGNPDFLDRMILACKYFQNLSPKESEQ